MTHNEGLYWKNVEIAAVPNNQSPNAPVTSHAGFLNELWPATRLLDSSPGGVGSILAQAALAVGSGISNVLTPHEAFRASF